MEEGTAKPSMSTKMWEEGPSEDIGEIEMAYHVASPFAAGISTVHPFTIITDLRIDDALFHSQDLFYTGRFPT